MFLRLRLILYELIEKQRKLVQGVADRYDQMLWDISEEIYPDE